MLIIMMQRIESILERTSVFKTILLVTVVSFVILLLRLAFVTELDFDSGYFALVPQTYFQDGIFGTKMYTFNNQLFAPFDTWVTVGYPFLAPLSVFYLIGHGDIFIMRIFMIMCFLLFTAILYRIFSKEVDSNISKLLLVALLSYFITSYGIFQFSIRFYGEIPAALMVMYGVYVLYKSENTRYIQLVLAGIGFGLAMSTKLIFMFYIAPLLFVYCVQSFLNKNLSIRAILSLVIGITIPFLIHYLWVSHYVPFHVWYADQQLTWATQQVNFFKEGAFSIVDATKSIRFFITTDPLFILFSGYFVYLVLTIKRLQKPHNIALVFTLLYFFFLYHSIFPRHLWLMKIYIFMLTSTEILKRISFNTQKRTFVGITLYACTMILVPIILLPQLKSQVDTFKERQFAQVVREEYKDDALFFLGWWRFPDVQYLSNKNFILFNKENYNNLCKIKSKCYIVVGEDVSQHISGPDYVQYKAGLIKPEFNQFGYELYKITPEYLSVMLQ